MNDLELIKRYGPDAPPGAPEALTGARARLLREVSAPGRPRSRWLRPAAESRPRWRVGVLAMAAIVVGAFLVALPAWQPADQPPGQPADPQADPPREARPQAEVTLVEFRTPEFPLTLRPLPAGLTAPVFSGGNDSLMAVHPSTNGQDDVIVATSSSGGYGSQEQNRMVDIDGRTGSITEYSPPGEPPHITLRWERRPGQWVGLTGNGRFGTEAAVRTLAASLVDESQQIALRIRLAPAGWTIAAFKGETILTLRDGTSNDPERTLSIHQVDAMDPDLFRKVDGARRISFVQINDARGHLIETDRGWYLQAPLPDGTAVNLQAPAFLTREQVIAMGEQVVVTPR